MSAADVDSRTLFDRTLLAPGVTLSGEARTTRADGAEIWLSSRAVNLLDEPDVRGIVVNLLTHSGYYDIALRDFGLMLAALTLARLASVYDAPLRIRH